MKKLFVSIFTLTLIVSTVSAQKFKVTKGSPEAMKDQQSIAIVFTYDNMKVGKMEEAAYLEQGIKKHDEKEAGTGQKWSEAWQSDKATVYPENFTKFFNAIANSKFGASTELNSTTAKYTMKVNTSFLEPGYNVGISASPAIINLTISFYETANPGVILFETTVTKCKGIADEFSSYDVASRVSSAYQIAAAKYAKFIYKTYFK